MTGQKRITKLKIAVVYGGRSVEHDVSVITAKIVMRGLKELGKYEVASIYINKEGRWVINDKEDKSRVVLDSSRGKLIIEQDGFFNKRRTLCDVMWPAMHGTYGEDGTIQGMCEMLDVPYVGCGIEACALAMDKVISKQIFAENGIPQVKYVWFLKDEWRKDKEDIYNRIEKELHYPIFIKPANLGSSIGVSKVTTRQELHFACEVATAYDHKIIAEQGIEDLMEINCAVLGYKDPIPSLLEQPITYKEFLTFDEKYLTKGGSMKGVKSKVKIPAPVSEEVTRDVQELAIKVFKILGCVGISRIDFLLDNTLKKVYVNEVNPMPGTLQKHLWEASGIPLSKLVERLIEIAIERYKEKEDFIYTFDSKLVS